MKIGIIGNGFVGKATQQLSCDVVELYCYDINPALCSPPGTTLQTLVDNCGIIFISVPTPMNKDGSCHTGILDSVVNELSLLCELSEKNVVIRCTEPPGTADRLNCYYMPEFLTEKNFMDDFKHNPEWFFGLKGTEQDTAFRQTIQSLFSLSKEHGTIMSDSCIFLPNKEAEMLKLFRNVFLSVKVGLCNEVYDYCMSLGIDYDRMRRHACNDSRIGTSHTSVPGHDGKRGFGGTCFPKDINNLNHLLNHSNLPNYIVKSVVARNEEVDRSEKDWLMDKGRASV